MRVSELYKQVYQLGFEDSLEDENRFYSAANRALLQVNAIRPAVRVYLINHQPMSNLISQDTFSPVEKRTDLYFEATGAKSYYFEADGNGMLYIERLDPTTGEWTIIGTQELAASRRFLPYRGFIKQDGVYVEGQVRLHFTGEYLYAVKNVALYEYLYSDDTEDIPAYEPYTRYDISALVSDFLALDAPPIAEGDGRERLNQGYDVEGGRIVLLPRSANGCFEVRYLHKPNEIVNNGGADEDEAIIDLDEELCSLLPLLVASYIWIEDEASMAQYYLALYRERALDIERRIKNMTPVSISNPSGW